MVKVEVIDRLQAGRAYAITGEALAEALGCNHRGVSLAVEKARKAGDPVCASCDSARPGYYLAESPGELSSYLASLDRRLRETRRTREALQRTLDSMTGQVSLWGRD